MTRTRPNKGDKVECPKCHRWVGFWPDSMNPYLAHLMPHNDRDPERYSRRTPVPCEQRTKDG